MFIAPERPHLLSSKRRENAQHFAPFRIVQSTTTGVYKHSVPTALFPTAMSPLANCMFYLRDTYSLTQRGRYEFSEKRELPANSIPWVETAVIELRPQRRALALSEALRDGASGTSER